jgi:hypothetical protein
MSFEALMVAQSHVDAGFVTLSPRRIEWRMGSLSARRGPNRQLLSNPKLSATRGDLGKQSSCDTQLLLENGRNRAATIGTFVYQNETVQVRGI